MIHLMVEMFQSSKTISKRIRTIVIMILIFSTDDNVRLAYISVVIA
jgi:hypothetical protein